MKYISTDESEKYDIKNGALTESPIRGSTTRFICNPIVDDIEADPPNGRARRKRVNGRVIIDTAVPDSEGYRYEPPSCLVTGDPSINDLAGWRWQGRTVDAETERELIRRMQEGDPRCRAGSSRGCTRRSCLAFFDPRPDTISLLPAFHHSIRKIVGGYVPKNSPRRKYERNSDSLIFQDLMAVGCFGLWKAALAFDFGNRFWTYAQPKIEGLVANAANYQRRNGMGGGSRIDRWIFSHLGSPPEAVLEAQSELRLKRPVFHSLQEAADALKAANNLEHPDVYSDSGDDDIERDSYSTVIKTNTATEPLEEFRDVYDAYDRLKWSPQLGDSFASQLNFWIQKSADGSMSPAPHKIPGHKEVSAIVDFWIKEFCDPPRIKAKPQPKPVYPPCTVKPTGRVLHPIDKPYWMEPREKPPDILERKPPYDPDRREVATVRLKNGKTKRQYRQMRAEPDRSHAEWWSEYCAHPYAASYAKYIQEQEARKVKPSVRPNREQENGSPVAEIVVLESRRSGKSTRQSATSAGRHWRAICV